jgi:predicted lipoprotein with Yx(FWY)xxD motif
VPRHLEEEDDEQDDDDQEKNSAADVHLQPPFAARYLERRRYPLREEINTLAKSTNRGATAWYASPMATLRSVPLATVVLAVALAGAACGGENASGGEDPGRTARNETSGGQTTATTTAPAPDNEAAQRPEGEDGLRVAARRAQITTEDSDFGRVLFDANGQVVYVFEIDRRDRSNCTSTECVRAWPPVLTEEPPTAGAGVDASLLGTMRRSDGTLQVTYRGRPLYFYEHERPGEIKCHNVDLHGGLWWVVTPSGDAAA